MPKNIREMLTSFEAIELLKNTYSENYKKFQYKGLSGWAHKIYHKKLEGKYNFETKFDNVLEIGSGSGEHYHYVKHKYNSYVMTEYDKKQIEILKKRFIGKKKVKIEFADIEKLHYADGYFDRIIITCVLHHLNDIPKALSEIRRVARSEGVLSIYVPADPGIFYRFTRMIAMIKKNKIRLISGDVLKRKVLNAIEHPNHVQAIRDLIEYFFRKDNIKVSIFPFKIDLWNLNLFYVYQIKKNEN